MNLQIPGRNLEEGECYLPASEGFVRNATLYVDVLIWDVLEPRNVLVFERS